MAQPKCPNPKCESHTKFRRSFFELYLDDISKSDFKHHLVQCSTCGTVIGILDFLNIGATLEDQNNSLNIYFNKREEENAKIYNELILQSEAIKKIMEKIGLDIY